MSDWIARLLAAELGMRRRDSGNPVELLIQEHRLISDAAFALESWALWVEQGQRLERECMQALARFLDFVGHVHHDKEERVLLPTLVAAGLLPPGADGGLAADHHQERYLVGELCRLVDEWEDAPQAKSSHFASLARELIGLQRRHLEMESRDIYPLIGRLDGEGRRALQEGLAGIDRANCYASSAWRSVLRRLLDPRTVLSTRKRKTAVSRNTALRS